MKNLIQGIGHSIPTIFATPGVRLRCVPYQRRLRARRSSWCECPREIMRLQCGRVRFLASGAAVFFIGTALAFNASATTIDITFTATNGAGIVGSNSIDAAPGDLLTATVSIGADAAGVAQYGISVMFDMDFGDELDLVFATELLHAPLTFNLDAGCASTQESTGALVGNVLTCEAGTFGAGPPPPV